MRRAWFTILLVLTFCVTAFTARPAWALATPEAVKALSSASTQVGQAICDTNGNPYLDAYGRPLMVTGCQTDPAQATATSLANMLKMPVADLLAYAGNLGMTLPLMLTGTMTTVSRSDGGVEHVFCYVGSGGETFVFLADQTGPNVYGVRIANIRPNGMGTVLTAHGLNGNFSNPPWYLSAEARAQYWMNTQIAQVIAPPHPTPGPTQPPPVAGGGHGQVTHDAKNYGQAGVLSFVSDTSSSTGKLTLNGSRRAAIMRHR